MRRFKLNFNINKCKGCELCVAFCPKNVIAIDESVTNAKGYHPAAAVDIAACVGCCSCARMCPDCVITIYQLEEGEE